MVDLLRILLDNVQVRWLVGLILANLVLGVVAAAVRGELDLELIADWLQVRVLPLTTAYVVAAGLAWFVGPMAIPGINLELPSIRDIAFTTLVLFLARQLLKNLVDLGVPVPGLGVEPAADDPPPVPAGGTR